MWSVSHQCVSESCVLVPISAQTEMAGEFSWTNTDRTGIRTHTRYACRYTYLHGDTKSTVKKPSRVSFWHTKKKNYSLWMQITYQASVLLHMSTGTDRDTQAHPHSNTAMPSSSTSVSYQLFVHLTSYQWWWLIISLNMQNLWVFTHVMFKQ